MQRSAALGWTPHLDEYLRVLAAEKECPNDQTLIQLVRLQEIVERASHVTQCGGENAADSNDSLSQTESLPLYLKALESQLGDLKRDTPAEVQQNGTYSRYLAADYDSD